MRDNDNFPTIIVIALILGAIGGCVKCATGGCGDGYSEGERVGSVYKFSRKGISFKSWEGELNLGGMTTDANGHMVMNTWDFTVTRPEVVPEVQKALESGHRVKLHYRQWWSSPWSMDSSYDVDGVVETQPAKASP